MRLTVLVTLSPLCFAANSGRTVALPEECKGKECVLTHRGWWPKECVHNVPNGTFVHSSTAGVHVSYPDGSNKVFPDCTAKIPRESNFPGRDALQRPERNVSRAIGPINPEENNAWPVTWWMQPQTVVDYFSADYTLPHGGNEGLVGSWWIGVEPSDCSSVLQPVVYKHAHGDKWHLVTENCCPGGHDFRHGDVAISDGSQVHGVLQRETGTKYTISMTANGKTYTLQADNGKQMDKPLIALETYDTQYNCNELPAGTITATRVQTKPQLSFGRASGSALSKCGWSARASGDTVSASPPHQVPSYAAVQV